MGVLGRGLGHIVHSSATIALEFAYALLIQGWNAYAAEEMSDEHDKLLTFLVLIEVFEGQLFAGFVCDENVAGFFHRLCVRKFVVWFVRFGTNLMECVHFLGRDAFVGCRRGF